MNTKTLYIGIAASIAAAAALITTSPLTEAADTTDDESVEEALAAGELTPVISPVVPLSMEFAGKQISFDRTDMYERLDRELTSMTYTHGNTMLMIKRANRFFPVLAPILKKNGVPLDMLYLATIESSLNIRAYSPAKAAGLWQFIPSTAKQFGLEVNEFVDERYHIEKATTRHAVISSKPWPNTATGKAWQQVTTAAWPHIRRRWTNSWSTMLSTCTSSRRRPRYPFRIMAAKLIMENPTKYGFRLSADQLYQPISYKEVTVDTP